MAFWNKISRFENQVEIPGTFLHAFIHNGNRYYLTEIKIYQDGMIDCWGLVNFEKFKEKVAHGWVVTALPENARVTISLLASFKVSEVSAWVQEAEFIKEVADEIERLNNRPTSSDKCLQAYQQFQIELSEAARQTLKEAYEAVPEHLRQYILGDMDVKDIPLRMTIYGEEELEDWSHRVVGRVVGVDPLPSITVQGALKRDNL